jgi:hypothetical protein
MAAKSVSDSDSDLDAPIYGAEAIGREGKTFQRNSKGEVLVDKAGKPVVDKRKAFYFLEKGYWPARKVGYQWMTTKRRMRSFLNGEPDPGGWTPPVVLSPKQKAERAA